MNIKEINAKSIITKSQLPEVNYVLNPYVGCSHGCIYCYADFMKRFTNHTEDWGEFVDVKINSADLIKQVNGSMLISSVTDPYQAIEGKYKITRECLKKLKYSDVEILTKSPLVVRDVDLFKQFKILKVGLSIGVLDENVARKIEPFVPSPSKRIEALKDLFNNGIYTYCFVSPIFPEISEVEEIIDAVKDYVKEIWFENLNIRGNNRLRILKFIKEYDESLLDLYRNIPDSYWERVKEKIVKKCEKEKIKYKIFFHHGKVKNKI